MNFLIILIKGILMGIFIAFPNGPVSFIIMRRMSTQGMRLGMYSVLGALVMDIFYITCVGLGLSLLSYIPQEVLILGKVIAGLVLFVSGYRMIYETTREIRQEMYHDHPFRAFFSIAFLNMLNPGLMVSLGAVFLLMGMGSSIGHRGDIGLFLVGFAFGTLLLWSLIGFLIQKSGDLHHNASLRKITHGVGYLLMIFGSLSIFYEIFSLL